ncbi:MAG: TRAP transporter large permease subunit, partial [Desulfitobacteriaceae bacterium]
LIGATIFGQFFAVTKIPMEAASFIGGLHISRYLIVAGILVVYLILGCFMEGIAIMVLTVPIIYPIITHLGFSGIWFGVVLTMMLNIGALTPPVGISVYVMSSFAKDVPMQDIFRGVMPLLASMIFCVILVTIFPQIITFLPSLMK